MVVLDDVLLNLDEFDLQGAQRVLVICASIRIAGFL
jgi:hypothetical protein